MTKLKRGVCGGIIRNEKSMWHFFRGEMVKDGS